METNNLPKTVFDFLESEEKLAKIGILEIKIYNRYLEFFSLIYGKKENILKDLKSDKIQSFLVYQMFSRQKNLFIKDILGDEIYNEIEKIYNKTKLKFK